MGTAHNSKQSGRSKPIAPSVAADPPSSDGRKNWREEADKAARRKKRYKDWSNNRMMAFDAVRYPFLRPDKSATEDHERMAFEKAEKQFENNLSFWNARIEQEEPRVILGLTFEQCDQVVALVWDSVESISLFKKVKPAINARAKIAKEGLRREKMLRRKLQKVIKGLQELREYAETLDWQYGFEELALQAEIRIRRIGSPQLTLSAPLCRQVPQLLIRCDM